jgi:Domain of unknown function (DUF222)
MCTETVPATWAQAQAMLDDAIRFMAAQDTAGLPAAAAAERLRALECHDAVQAAVRGRLLAGFSAQDGPVEDGHRSIRAWLVHSTRVTRAQAAEHQAVQALAEHHPALTAALAAGGPLSKSEALQLAKWTKKIPDACRSEAEDLLVAAAQRGVDLHGLAALCAEILARTAEVDPDGRDPGLDRALSLHTTLDGAGVVRGDLTPECAAMVQSVLDALSAPQGSDDQRTRAQRYHDGLAEAMKRLLASDLLPQRAGQPVKALVHIYFAELRERDGDGILQDKWIAEYRARWAACRAANSVSPGDGGAWLEGDAARAIAVDAMIIPVVTADIDPSAIDDLIALCVELHELRTQPVPAPAEASAPAETLPPAGTPASAETPTSAEAPAAACPGVSAPGSAPASSPGPGTSPAPGARPDPASPAGLTTAAARRTQLTATTADTLAELEHQILAKILDVVSGPGGAASFLRRNLLGKPLAGPSLPLDVGRTDDIPLHLRRLVSLRDQRCQYPGGCDQPTAQCEPHHVVHRKDGGTTSLPNLKNYCGWHHHVVLHELGWTLTVHPDGTSQVTSPDGKTIHSHAPPPRPG